jgi:hypothetical protein
MTTDKIISNSLNLIKPRLTWTSEDARYYKELLTDRKVSNEVLEIVRNGLENVANRTDRVQNEIGMLTDLIDKQTEQEDEPDVILITKPQKRKRVSEEEKSRVTTRSQIRQTETKKLQTKINIILSRMDDGISGITNESIEDAKSCGCKEINSKITPTKRFRELSNRYMYMTAEICEGKLNIYK